MAPKHKSSDPGKSHMPKRNHKVLPFTAKVKVLALIRGKVTYTADGMRLLTSMVRMNLLFVKL